jgi:peptide/nickel transport system substrate-binding protein
MILIFRLRTIFILLFFLSIFSLSVSPKDPPRKYDDTLYIGDIHKPGKIDPLLSINTVTSSIIDLCFENIVRIENGEVVPAAAYKWEIKDKGKTYIFRFHKNIKFHNNRPLTVKDVVYSLDEAFKKRKEAYKEIMAVIDSYQGIDEHTLEITLKTPFSPFLTQLSEIYIMPQNYYKYFNKLKVSEYKNMGNGPYRLMSFNPNKPIVLKRNKNYYKKPPSIERIVIKIYKDFSILWSAFMKREIDMIYYVNNDDYKLIRDDPCFKKYITKGAIYYTLAYNHKSPLLKSKDFRLAMAMSIDRKRIIKNVFEGLADEAIGPFPSNYKVYNEEIKPIEFSPKRARNILKRLGFEDKDKDGILEKEGKDLEIFISFCTRSRIEELMAMEIRQQLNLLGIKVKIELSKKISEFINKLDSSDFGACLMLFNVGVDPDSVAMRWHYKSLKEGRWWNYKNRELGELLEKGRTTIDWKERKEIYKKVHKIIYDDQPALFICFPYFFWATSERVEISDNDNRSIDIRKWRIKK